MTQPRLIADDLTGALDSAAAFVPAFGPQRVVWGDDPAGAAALSSGTREATAAEARRKLAALASFLAPAPGRISVFKLDSLLRGHAGVELAAVIENVRFAHVVIAPAMPFQGRITREGRQMARSEAGWQIVGEDIAATLRACGHAVANCRPGDPLPDGISIWDAETDSDLVAVVAGGRRAAGPVLWVGAAGLAAALAGAPSAAALVPARPLLGLIGTDHPVMRGQLAAVAEHCVAVGDDGVVASAALTRRLANAGLAFAVPDLPQASVRETARGEIACRFAGLLTRIERPAALFVSGGETLADVVAALGASALDVAGAFEPGVPVSRLVGGRWDGLIVYSKSGAFGAPNLLLRLTAGPQPIREDARP